MKMTKRLMAIAMCGVMAASSMVGMSASAANIPYSTTETGIINNSQVGYYYNTKTSASNYDSSAYIYICQDYIYLHHVYIDGYKVRANIYKDDEQNNFSVSDGIVSFRLDANGYLYEKNGRWVTGTATLQEYGDADCIIYSNPLNPVWTFEFGGQSFEEEH